MANLIRIWSSIRLFIQKILKGGYRCNNRQQSLYYICKPLSCLMLPNCWCSFCLFQSTYSQVHPDCRPLLNNDYKFHYSCNMQTEAAILACVSLLLTVLNILCIFLMGIIVLKVTLGRQTVFWIFPKTTYIYDNWRKLLRKSENHALYFSHKMSQKYFFDQSSILIDNVL